MEMDTMKDFTFSRRVTFEGFTYYPENEYTLSDELAEKLLHNFSQFMAEVHANAEDRAEEFNQGLIDATRGAKELAEQFGIDLSTIAGSGLDGRITKADVEAVMEVQE